jgi:hypothetical protein
LSLSKLDLTLRSWFEPEEKIWVPFLGTVFSSCCHIWSSSVKGIIGCEKRRIKPMKANDNGLMGKVVQKVVDDPWKIGNVGNFQIKFQSRDGNVGGYVLWKEPFINKFSEKYLHYVLSLLLRVHGIWSSDRDKAKATSLISFANNWGQIIN